MKILKVLISCLFFITFCKPISAEIHALLVGIGDYQSSRFHSLKGPPADLELMETILKRHFGLKN